jgi:hypothetical protein
MRLSVRGEYPPDWHVIAHRVKSEAGWRCVRCGTPHGPCPDVLTVHHLDGDKGNCAWWNLLALDQRCHLTIQARVIPERPWLFEHSAWMIPYVCGFYARYYAQVDITRGEAEGDPDRWLALGQPWLYQDVVAAAGGA